jgi:hypothetical protein
MALKLHLRKVPPSLALGALVVVSRSRRTVCWRGRIMTRSHEAQLDPSHWAIDDEVIQLRVRGGEPGNVRGGEPGSERVFPLPASNARSTPRGRSEERWLVGTSSECEIQLPGSAGNISERHALLLRNGMWWLALALGDSPNLLVDGDPQAAVQLVPGTELEIGDLSLVAESLGSIALRSFLQKLLGSSVAADHALRQLRLAQTAQTQVILRGQEALLPIARELHRRVYGAARPFVVHRELPSVVRGPLGLDAPRFVDVTAAMEAARGGTLCLLGSCLPRDYPRLCQAYADSSGTQTQVVVCDDAGLLSLGDPAAIAVPSLASRPDELLSLVFELGAEAMRDRGLEEPFRLEEAVAVLRHDTHSFMGICEATRRVAAMRKTGSLFAAARLLQVDARALRRWLGARELSWLDGHLACEAN